MFSWKLSCLTKLRCSQSNDHPALSFAPFSAPLSSFPLVLSQVFQSPVSPTFPPKAETKTSFLPADSLESTSDGGQSFILLRSILSLSSLLEMQRLRQAAGQRHQEAGGQSFSLGPLQVLLLQLRQSLVRMFLTLSACVSEEPVVLLVVREARPKLWEILKGQQSAGRMGGRHDAPWYRTKEGKQEELWGPEMKSNSHLETQRPDLKIR